MSGAGEMNRTPDLLITNELLYRLSYTGTKLSIIARVLILLSFYASFGEASRW